MSRSRGPADSRGGRPQSQMCKAAWFLIARFPCRCSIWQPWSNASHPRKNV